MPGHNRCFLLATQFANRNSLNLFSADLFDNRCARPLIDDGIIHHFDVRDVNRLVDDRGVVDNDRRRANRFKKPTFFHKNKRLRSGVPYVNSDDRARANRG